MNEASLPLAGHPVVPASQIESIIDTLTEIAGQLEELYSQLSRTQLPSEATPTPSDIEMRVEQALLTNLCSGSESFSAAGIADAVAAELALRGDPVPVVKVRRMLPPLMLRLFNAKPSCSLKRDGKYVRGYRGLAAR